MTQCAICQGYPPENVLSQYVQTDPSKIPIPLVDPADEVVTLYPEERIEAKIGKWGFLRPLYRAIAWITEPAPEAPVSKQIAKRKKNKGLFEPLDE